ncbi:hypothetical protein [Paenibacillus sp. Y412MC10]|uniref:hypothetical protein n=1 Tax=Geobacillus sp. (strain Y412MC10) TaxID=481743 RepID=UPI001642D61B|nr:hypothetical protein [Paenibacillus sp. Y412MC10]
MVLKPEKKVRNAAAVIQLLKDAGFDVQTQQSKVKEPEKGFSALIGKRNRPLVLK